MNILPTEITIVLMIEPKVFGNERVFSMKAQPKGIY
jgi:hypothetical protein